MGRRQCVLVDVMPAAPWPWTATGRPHREHTGSRQATIEQAAMCQPPPSPTASAAAVSGTASAAAPAHLTPLVMALRTRWPMARAE